MGACGLDGIGCKIGDRRRLGLCGPLTMVVQRMEGDSNGDTLDQHPQIIYRNSSWYPIGKDLSPYSAGVSQADSSQGIITKTFK